MVMKPEPLIQAIALAREESSNAPVYLLSPQGKPFTQQTADRWSKLTDIVLVCGRYEGIDARVENHVDGLVSLGDFVLSGGELAAMTIVDAVCRLIPEVMGRQESLEEESFVGGMLEYPQYTRPAKLGDEEVPPVLLSGNHAEISRWRREQQLRVTWQRRPDLLKTAPLGGEDVKVLTKVVQEP
jgi:tRNA (guanine37-N1)-methyltransferase